MYDGDGQGDDRRLMLMMKNVAKFCNVSNRSEDDHQALKKNHDRIVAQVSQAEWIHTKNRQIQQMNQTELNNYEELYR